MFKSLLYFTKYFFLPDFCFVRNFFSFTAKLETASDNLEFQRVLSLTLRASRPSTTSPSFKEKPTVSSSFLTLGPRFRVFKNMGCLYSFRLTLWCLSKEN